MTRTFRSVPLAALASTLLAFGASPAQAQSTASFDAESFVHLAGFPITPPDPSLAATIVYDAPAGPGTQGFVHEIFMAFAGTSFVIGAGAATITEVQTRSGLDFYDVTFSLYPWDFDFRLFGRAAYITYSQHGQGKFGEWGSVAPARDNSLVSIVPEPQGMALMLAGLAVVGSTVRRKKRQ